MPLPSTTGSKLRILVGEKGAFWRRIRVRDTAGHGSMPFRTDNALVKAAEVVRRIAEFQPRPKMQERWRRFAEAYDLPAELAGEWPSPTSSRCSTATTSGSMWSPFASPPSSGMDWPWISWGEADSCLSGRTASSEWLIDGTGLLAVYFD